MKKIVLCLMATTLSLTFLPLVSSAQKTDTPSSLTTTKPGESLEVKIVKGELNESKEMNKSNLKSNGKKNLQQIEIRSERHYHRHGVMYVSAGGVFLFILLIIILL